MPNGRGHLRSEDIKADRDALTGVRSLGDYAPRNEAHSVARLTELQQAMDAAHKAVVDAGEALAATRAAEAEAERAFHEGILGVKAEVIAQYGPDSDAVRVVGLRPKSERRRPTRHDNGTNGTE